MMRLTEKANNIKFPSGWYDCVICADEFYVKTRDDTKRYCSVPKNLTGTRHPISLICASCWRRSEFDVGLVPPTIIDHLKTNLIFKVDVGLLSIPHAEETWADNGHCDKCGLFLEKSFPYRTCMRHSDEEVGVRIYRTKVRPDNVLLPAIASEIFVPLAQQQELEME